MMACTPKNVLLSAKIYPVQWFPGFNLIRFLAGEAPVKNQQDIQALLDKPWYSPFKLENVQTKRVFNADRCNQILPTITQLWTHQASETNPYAELAAMCVAAYSIANARPAQYSALSDFRLDADFPLHAPKNLAFFMSSTEKQRILQNETIVNWAQVEKMKFISKGDQHQARYELVGAYQKATLIARGDFNYDGAEDLLLFVQSYVVDGTYASFRLFWLTKTNADSPLTLIKEYPPQDRVCNWPAC